MGMMNEGGRQWERFINEDKSPPAFLSFALTYTLISLSFSIHLLPPPITYIHTVLPSLLSPGSSAECCIIPSMGEAGKDGGRDGGEEGARGSRENDSRCNKHHNATLLK